MFDAHEALLVCETHKDVSSRSSRVGTRKTVNDGRIMSDKEDLMDSLMGPGMENGEGSEWRRNDIKLIGEKEAVEPARQWTTLSQSLLPAATPLQRRPRWGHPETSIFSLPSSTKVHLRG